ncbi:hypothetical protein [Lactococcus phage 1358]|uniref:Uncharacterized protein n=1 Tax=Lactococcus phage 1358 TaxID=741942 RepID=D3W0F6_9CAUD|nr:hypothetical protein ABG43_gp25 [Lactococcus phage 1358]ADD25722.1 hypothetical protein [Lactococcus phage 1358]
MTIKLAIMGDNVADVIKQAQAFIAENSGSAPITLEANGIKAVVSPAAAAAEKEEQAAKLKAEHVKANTNIADGSTTNEFDGVRYGTKTIKRNTWLDLKDGRVLFVKAGGRMPEESEIEARLTKNQFDAKLEEGTDIALTIAEVVESWTEDDVPNANEVNNAEEEAEDDDSVDEENEDEDEAGEADEEEEEEEEDGEEDYTVEEVKDLVKEIKEIKGGKKFVKELLEEYDVKIVKNLDEDELQEVGEELDEWLEEHEEA